MRIVLLNLYIHTNAIIDKKKRSCKLEVQGVGARRGSTWQIQSNQNKKKTGCKNATGKNMNATDK